jgi:G:T-mismatch repair DNA endonuclease (very short patch repair protein)
MRSRIVYALAYRLGVRWRSLCVAQTSRSRIVYALAYRLGVRWRSLCVAQTSRSRIVYALAYRLCARVSFAHASFWHKLQCTPKTVTTY